MSRHSLIRHSWLLFIIFLLFFIFLLYRFAWHESQGGFDLERLIILIAIFVVGLLSVRIDDDRLRLILWLAVALFAVGHRSVYIGHWTLIVPSEAIIGGLFILLLMRTSIRHRWQLGRIPRSLQLLVAWTFMGVVLTLTAGVHWDNVFEVGLVWLFALPSFAVVTTLITKPSHLEWVWKLLIGVSLYMSLLATIERFLPQMVSILSVFYSAERSILLGQAGFARTMYTFWGNPIGVSLVVWGAIILAHRAIWSEDTRKTTYALAGFALCMVGIYVAGARSAWIALLMGLSFLVISSGRRRLLPLLLILIFLLVMPTSFWARFGTLLPVFGTSGLSYQETGINWRLETWTRAAQSLLAHPFLGIGFGGRLAHNAFLAFGARLGFPALILFIVLLYKIFRGLFRLYSYEHSPQVSRTGQLFLTLGIAWFVDINVHPVLSIPTMAIPYWFMFALAWQAPKVLISSEQAS